MHLKHHIDMITPGIALVPRSRISARSSNVVSKSNSEILARAPKFKPLHSNMTFPTSNNLTGCDKFTDVACLRALYDIHYEPKHTDRNTFAIGTSYILK